MSFDQLLTIPEQDEWIYSDGKSTTCVAFILAMYKEAGIFAPFTESIQVTEFTVSVQVDACPHISCSLFLSQYISSSWFYMVHITKSHLHCLTLFFLPQIRDAYMLKIFDDNPARLPTWCNTESDKLPFCQILGEYRMELPEYNTIEPYAKMNENCPSLPPTYKRPARCWPWDCLLSLLQLLFTHWK